MPTDRLIWDSIPSLPPGGFSPGAARRRRTDAAARRLQAERAAMAAITAWQGDGVARTRTLCDGGRLRRG